MAKKVLEISELELDKIEMSRLAKIVSPSYLDMDSIFSLYRKYINNNAPMYNTTGCQTCGASIANYWRSLMTYYQSII